MPCLKNEQLFRRLARSASGFYYCRLDALPCEPTLNSNFFKQSRSAFLPEAISGFIRHQTCYIPPFSVKLPKREDIIMTDLHWDTSITK